VKKQSCFMPEMTKPEIEKLIANNPTVILPLGATESYGNHLPTGTEAFIAEGISRRIGEKANVLVAPVLNFSWVDWLTDSGTIKFRQQTIIEIIEQLSLSLVKQGIKKILFLNAHFGHVSASHVVARALHQHHGIKCASVEIYGIGPTFSEGILETKRGAWGHGSEGPTSLVLALRPELVDMDQARPDFPVSKNDKFKCISSNTVEFEGRMINYYQHFDEITQTGITGDPTSATKEKGEKLIEKMTDYLTKFVLAL
jgi:creatinine amidohydrolase